MPDCPRCNVPLSTVTASPAPGLPPLNVDSCGRCAGLWLDGAELAPASSVLGGLPHRLNEIAQVAVPSSFACPRCRGLMLAFDLLDTQIDLCRECMGVWLDGGEFAQIALAQQREAAGPKRPPPPDRVACKSCNASVPFGETYYSDRGLVCVNCHQSSDAPEAINQRGEAVRQAYAEYEARQGAVMAYNRRPEPSSYTSSSTVEQEIASLRREIRHLRWQID